MSGIYIPIKGKVKDGTFCQVIVVDGVPKVFTFGSNNVHLEHLTDGIVVPDHGRLIDADALWDRAYKSWGTEYDPWVMSLFMDFISDAPTIIPRGEAKDG